MIPVMELTGDTTYINAGKYTASRDGTRYCIKVSIDIRERNGY